MENEIHLTLGIWGFTDITHQDITTMLDLQPAKIHMFGERINPKFLPIAQENGWMFVHSKIVTESFEKQMTELVSLLKSKSQILKQLSEKYYCELSCAIFKKSEDKSLPWVHLNKDHIDFLKEFNIEFDLDLYA
ncbi:MAG TPA: DUF4279 domain-containing protein [Chryseolinea sp.]|nr:DUF4279 domain-containing protein [Chryseolinea sp.]